MEKLIGMLTLFIASSVCLANDLGKTTYDMACKNCHAPEFSKAIKAPTAFNKKQWDVRFEKAKIEAEKSPNKYKTPMDYLLYNVTIGKGLMHHGGLCKEADVPEADCSDKALMQAIYYMSGQ